MTVTCPSCGSSQPGSARFCGHCGARLGPGSTDAGVDDGPRRPGVMVRLVGGAIVAGLVVAAVSLAGTGPRGATDRGATDPGQVALPTEDLDPPGPTPPGAAVTEGPVPAGVEAVDVSACDSNEVSFECPAWQVETTRSEEVFSRPTIADGDLYVGVGSRLVSMASTTGEVRWAVDVGAGVVQPPVVVERSVYVVAEDGTVTAVRRSTGTTRWQMELDGSPWDRPVAAGTPATGANLVDGVLVVPLRGRVAGIDLADGTQRWTVAVSGQPSPPALSRGTVFFGDGNGEVRAVDVETGEVTWSFPGETLDGGAVADGWYVATHDDQDVVLTSGFSGPLIALDRDTGSLVWRSDEVQGWAQPYAAPGGTDFYALNQRSLWAVDSADGQATRIAGEVDGALAAVGPQGLLYVSDPPIHVEVLAPDGTSPWQGTWSAGVAEVEVGWVADADPSTPFAEGAPWMVGVSGSRRTLVGLAGPERSVATGVEMEAGGRCPVTPLQERPYGTVVAGRHLEFVGFGRPEPRPAMLVLDTDQETGPITLRGRRLDGTGRVGFRMSFDEPPHQELTLTTDGKRFASGWPPHWGVAASVPAPGCWSIDIAGPGYPDQVVVEITPEEFDALPDGHRHEPGALME